MTWRSGLVAAGVGACGPLKAGPVVSLPEEIPVDRAEGVDPAIADAVEGAVLAMMAEESLPGLAVALVDDGVVVYAGGFGWADVEARRPLTADTPVLLSSVSKTFVGVAAMQAVEAGRVSLDTPASDLLAFDLVHPGYPEDPVTLRHMLTHVSGVRDGASYFSTYVEGDPPDALGAFCADRLVPGGDAYRRGHWATAPGEAYEYSNAGMACAAQALAEADPEADTFDDLLKRDVWGPLGMTGTAYFLTDLLVEPAVPYDRLAGGRVRAWPQYGYPSYPDGMIRSPARDLGRYVSAMTYGGELDGVRVLQERSVAAMFTVDESLGGDEDGQAIAWGMRRLRGVPLLGHNGGDLGSLTELWLDPETRDGFALAANGFPSTFDAILDLEAALMEIVGE